MQDFLPAIKELGLTENETKTYLALLRSGPSTAVELTLKTKIHRISVYNIITRLQEKGIISYAMIGKRKYFEAADPRRFLEILEEKKLNFEHILPELLSQKSLAETPNEATLFKDKTGVKNILRAMTASTTPLYLFASGWGFKDVFPNYYPQWHALLEQNKVDVKVLKSMKSKGAEQPKIYDIKYLPSEFIFPAATAIYEDKVAIIIWSCGPTGIVISGKEVSDSYRQYFHMLWKIAKR